MNKGGNSSVPSNSDNRSLINVLGVPIDALDLNSAVGRVVGWVEKRTHSYGIFRDAHGIVQCQNDGQLARIHKGAGMIAPDGMPLVWLARRKWGPSVSRVYGPDFLEHFFLSTAGKGYRHYFYGATPDTVDKLITRLREIDPRLVVAGVYCPPFRPLTKDENLDAVRRINESHAEIVWVGLSTPKQEYWMAAQRAFVDAPVMLGVGAAFDFVSGTKLQAPAWIRASGFEWLFRLITEPRRLAGRYFRTIPRFVYLLLMQEIGLKHYE